MQRKAKLADNRLIGRRVAERPAEPFDLDVVALETRRNGDLVAVDQHSNREAIDFRNSDARLLR
ncbi:MAG TPA: hypothetical protein VJY34_15545 [Roseiarcus sp.]|nr:hypothetical protein [Roseiarcus sp.]